MRKVLAKRGEYIEEVNPKTLTTRELCEALGRIRVDVSESWMPDTDRDEGYAAIKEAIRRLKANDKTCATEKPSFEQRFGKYRHSGTSNDKLPPDVEAIL